MPAANSISAVFPCYNEQDSIRSVYESASGVLAKIGMDYEIILVNDGSTDRTPQIMDEIAARDSRVKIIHHRRNLGYGAAVRSGIRAGAGSLLFYSDGDGQFDLDELPPLLPLMQRYDVVSCYRLNRRDGAMRTFNAWCWTRLVRALFHLNLRDINCAFKLFKREVFEDMPLQSTGALIGAEILARAQRSGFSIVQVGVHHFPRTHGRQTGANPGVIFRACLELAGCYRRIKRQRHSPKK
ncbi:MAG: glycosyltransferase family 2 protein [Verrucomicrobiota bacterium]|nr:glycosyltransferase family 2 protein [Verrucomicrobiota bacterium]